MLTAVPDAHGQEPPWSPGALLAHYNHWQDREVTVAAYPALFMSPAPWKPRLMELGAEPKPQTPALAVCASFTPPNDDRIASADLLIVRGAFARRKVASSDSVPHQIELKDCKVLSIGGTMPEDGDPWAMGDAPVPLGALHDAVFDIVGETVRVKGFYWGTTYASASDMSRHDMQDHADFIGKKPVGCFQDGKAKAPRAVLDNRQNTVIEGEVALTAHSRTDRVDIANCRFVQGD